MMPVKICYTPDAKAWAIMLKQLGLPDDTPYPTQHGRCESFESPKYSELIVVIVINPKPGTTIDQIVGLIAHEATHALQFTMEKMHPGYEVERHQEVEAYFVQWVTQNVFVEFNAHWKGRKYA